jgi:hypothetical protein
VSQKVIDNTSLNKQLTIHFLFRYIYREICPLYGIKKVHCRADGAGCFSSVAVKVAMPLWDERTGVTELTYKHNVPGKGKTGLDGQFGVLSHHLKRLVGKQ